MLQMNNSSNVIEVEAIKKNDASQKNLTSRFDKVLNNKCLRNRQRNKSKMLVKPLESEKLKLYPTRFRVNRIKKAFVILVVTMLVDLCECYAQNQEHLAFMGVPINGELSAFVKQMNKLGFTITSGETYLRGIRTVEMSGNFHENKCVIAISSTALTRTVFLVSVNIFEKKIWETSKWKEVKNTYSKYKYRCQEKYGTPTEVTEIFSSPYKEGDGNEFKALREYKDSWYDTSWSLNLGEVIIEVLPFDNSGGWVRIHYFDKINKKIKDKEKQDAI